ncbi:MAG TPA: PQQ-binding-like beta-propeller repeat protein [Polyangiaceae bacterium]|nr:PQQ-binding-like beta-propeller repeat protein [Polyangiaceae bacterium]
MSRSFSLLTALGALPLTAACGGDLAKGVGAPFSETWQSDQGRSIAALEQKLRGEKSPAATPVAVGVTESSILGAPLPDGKVWTHSGSADTLPIVAGDLVLASSGGKLFALDAKSGKQLWSIDVEGRKLRGAGDDGTYTVAVVAGDSPGKSRFVAVSRSGDVVRQIDSTIDLGYPAAKGGVAFIPWSDQYVSAVDLKSGDELARLLLREIVSQARNYDGELWFGERGLVRFDERIRLATTNQGTRIGLPARQLPGKPLWLGSGNQLWPVNSSARLKIRMAATPMAEGESAHFTNHAYLASYFRVVIGLSDQDGSMKFVKSLSGDALGMSAGQHGFGLCDSSGKVSLLTEKGSDAGGAELGARLTACTVDITSLSVSGSQAPAPLAEQIGQALGELTPDMAVAQKLLVDELTKLDDPLVTKILIDLTSSVKIPPDLRSAARKLIATRRTGKEYMLAALERHYDYVSDVLLPPPLGPLSDALAAMNEVSATPLLARHLNDPANEMADVERAAVALGKLATPAEYEDLRTFFALYRATADEPSLVNAVVAVAGALLRIGGTGGKTLVERAAQDPLTQVDVKRGLNTLLTQPAAGETTPPSAPKAPNVAQNGKRP